jgi:hypothetical protein
MKVASRFYSTISFNESYISAPDTLLSSRLATTKGIEGPRPLPAGARLVTADAVSTHSNIHTDHGVASVKAWLLRHSVDDGE